MRLLWSLQRAHLREKAPTPERVPQAFRAAASAAAQPRPILASGDASAPVPRVADARRRCCSYTNQRVSQAFGAAAGAAAQPRPIQASGDASAPVPRRADARRRLGRLRSIPIQVASNSRKAWGGTKTKRQGGTARSELSEVGGPPPVGFPCSQASDLGGAVRSCLKSTVSRPPRLLTSGQRRPPR